jgi:hypothetical protein
LKPRRTGPTLRVARQARRVRRLVPLTEDAQEVQAPLTALLIAGENGHCAGQQSQDCVRAETQDNEHQGHWAASGYNRCNGLSPGHPQVSRHASETCVQCRFRTERQPKLSKSPSLTPSRNACHSSGVNRRTGPSGALLSRTTTPPSEGSATSTQSPFDELNELLTQLCANRMSFHCQVAFYDSTSTRMRSVGLDEQSDRRYASKRPTPRPPTRHQRNRTTVRWNAGPASAGRGWPARRTRQACRTTGRP